MSDRDFRFSILDLRLAGLLAMLLACGCHDIGTGSTGEMVVPQQKLQQIDTIDLASAAVARPTTLPATSPSTLPSTLPAEVSLSIEVVRRLAMENNLDLKVELLNPTIAKESLSQEEAAYEALFTTNASFGTTDQPTASELVGSQSTDVSVTPGLQIPLRTGGTVGLGVPMDRLSTNNQFSTLNPAYSSDAALTISQPLLRGFGVDVNAQHIRVAFYQFQQSQAQT